jgi:hypothetical protein
MPGYGTLSMAWEVAGSKRARFQRPIISRYAVTLAKPEWPARSAGWRQRIPVRGLYAGLL